MNSRALVFAISWGAGWVSIAILLLAHNAVSWQSGTNVAPLVCIMVGVAGAALGLVAASVKRVK